MLLHIPFIFIKLNPILQKHNPKLESGNNIFYVQMQLASKLCALRSQYFHFNRNIPSTIGHVVLFMTHCCWQRNNNNKKKVRSQ